MSGVAGEETPDRPSPARRRLRRDGLPAMVLFLLCPVLALCAGAAGHPAGVLDTEVDVRERTEGWRPLAAAAASEAGIPVDLLLALVSTESSGRAGARSPVGALGLTQVMPATARGEAVRLGLPDAGSLDLLEPTLNLRLGAAYLADRLAQFQGDEALALAAYHSGPAGPAAWRREDGAAPGLELVRSRGTPRTRAYVERVLRRRAWFTTGESL